MEPERIWQPAIRRAVAVFGLLLIPSIHVWFFQRLHSQSSVAAYFSWGLSFYGITIAVWLVARADLFRALGGWCRVGLYLVCFNCGWVVSTAVQDGLVPNSTIQSMPGTDIRHYGLAALLSHGILISAWCYIPIHLALGRSLSRDGEASIDSRFNIRSLVGWATLAAFILVTLRAMVEYGGPMNLAIASDGLNHAFYNMAIHVPIKLVGLFAVSAMMIGLTGCRMHTMLGFVSGLTILVLGGQIVVWLSTLAGSDAFTGGHVLANSWPERLAFVSGQGTIMFLVFLVSRLTGLQYRQGPSRSCRTTAS